MSFKANGIIAAMVTPPLTDTLQVNEKGLRRLVNYLIDGGVHGLFVVGTSGEFYGFSPEQRKEASKFVLMKLKVEYQYMQESMELPQKRLLNTHKWLKK